MNNKTKTSMILSTTIVALLVVMLAPTDVFATLFTDPVPFAGKLYGNTAELYFSCTSLSGLWVDYDWWGNCNTVKSEVQDAMNTFNGLDNALYLTTTSTHTDKIVYATNLGNYSHLAQATYPFDSLDWMRFNSVQHWSTSNGCDYISGYNLEYVANHELGHMVGLGHPDDSVNSMMVENCDATKYSTIQPLDKEVLNDKYQ